MDRFNNPLSKKYKSNIVNGFIQGMTIIRSIKRNRFNNPLS